MPLVQGMMGGGVARDIRCLCCLWCCQDDVKKTLMAEQEAAAYRAKRRSLGNIRSVLLGTGH